MNTLVGIDAREANLRPVLTIIITCYNTRDIVRDCLNSICHASTKLKSMRSFWWTMRPQTAPAKDGARDVPQNPSVAQRNQSKLLLLEQQSASTRLRGQFVLLLNNNDTLVPTACALTSMIEFLRDHPEAGVVGCKLLTDDGTVQPSVKSLPSPGAAIFGARSIVSKLFPHNRFTRQHLLHIDGDMTHPFVAGLVSGAASMIPLAVVKKVGHLDPQFFYHVDADYCKRIAEAGYKCYYLPTTSIVHLNHRGGTMANLPVRFQSLMKFECDSYRYYRKHMQTSSWSLMQIVVALGLSFHFLALASGQFFAELASAVRRS